MKTRGGMNDSNTTDSWIHIEKFSETHSWRQTWIFLGGAVVVFAFALLYEIDKDLRCKSDQVSINSLTHTKRGTSQRPRQAINSPILQQSFSSTNVQI